MEITNQQDQEFMIRPKAQRSEEVEHIIEKMPTKFGLWVTVLVGGLVLLMVIFGWVIDYPDIVTGEITINAQQAPIKLISANVGKITLLSRNQQQASAGEYIAYLQNAASIPDVLLLKKQLSSFNPTRYLNNPVTTFSSTLTLGELTAKYFNFLGATQDAYLYKNDNLLFKQKAELEAMLIQEKQSLLTIQQQLDLGQKNVQLNSKFYRRDSILFQKNFEPEADFDKARISYLNVLQGYNNTRQEFLAIKERLNNTQSQLEQVDTKIHQKEIQVAVNLNSAFNDLLDNIKMWEQKYVFIAPLNGRVQFLRFWYSDQFVQPGDEMFTIVPKQDKIIGQCILPAHGAGKVKIGQEVIIKLDNYPYREFGSIKGKVSNISLTTNILKTKEQNSINNYLVMVEMPNQLKTNYGSQLEFKFELKGVAEIVTEQRRLGSRLFDNLKQSTERN